MALFVLRKCFLQTCMRIFTPTPFVELEHTLGRNSVSLFFLYTWKKHQSSPWYGSYECWLNSLTFRRPQTPGIDCIRPLNIQLSFCWWLINNNKAINNKSMKTETKECEKFFLFFFKAIKKILSTGGLFSGIQIHVLCWILEKSHAFQILKTPS